MGGKRSSRAAIVVGVLFLLGAAGVGLAAREREQQADQLILRCEALEPGDDAVSVFSDLGLQGYRPGCGSRLPCLTLPISQDTIVRYGCDGSDCGLLWRIADAACYLEMGPDLIVRGADARRLDLGAAEP